MPLFRRRELWVPTWAGWLMILALFVTPVLLWWFFAEGTLARTVRKPADVLVVEAWIGGPGISAAVQEFHDHDYRWLVLTGGWTGEAWSTKRWSHVTVGEEQLRRAGFKSDHLVVAETVDAESHRTAASAHAAVAALAARGIRPTGVNVFTRSVHAQRSRIVFSRAFGKEIPVGSVGWIPPGADDRAWWQHSYRAEDLIEETVGVIYEILSGPFDPAPPGGGRLSTPD